MSRDVATPLPGSPFSALVLGTIATRFGEPIVRVHHARSAEPPPAWFDPLLRPEHLGVHLRGFSAYCEVALDREARAAFHPFRQVREAAERGAQLSFAEDFLSEVS